ncbi:MAG: 2-C-methyl-D-erythritol 4-phosphate cytidylyltransferase [Bacteroidales bacterium]
MKKNVIIVAGGKGKRAKTDIPKQFIRISGTPIIVHTIRKFIDYDTNINVIVVLPQEYIHLWIDIKTEFFPDINIRYTQGGEERFYSVKNGLELINDENSLTGIHDSVRPYITTPIIESCYTTAEKFGTAIPVIPCTDSLRIILPDGTNIPTDRTMYKLVQTPQVFRTDIIKRAYNQNYAPNFTDDASVVEAMGIKVTLTQGDVKNQKITTEYDLFLSKIILM